MTDNFLPSGQDNEVYPDRNVHEREHRIHLAPKVA